MRGNNSNGSCAGRARGFMALWIMLAIGLGVVAQPTAAAPLAYVTSSNGISVIDTGDNKVVDTIPCCTPPAVITPDGKHVYAFGPSTSDLVFKISVIDATNDKVVATVPLDVSLVGSGVSLNGNSSAIAVTPNGKYVYVSTGLCSSNSFDCVRPESVYFAAWMIDTVTNKVVAASAGKGIVDAIAFSPDGQHTYFANFDPYTVLPQVLVDSGISIPLPGNGTVFALAITPDGRHAYVPYVQFNNGAGSETVAIIDTVTNTVVKTVLVGTTPIGTTLSGVAVTPDGKYLYVTNQGSNSVAVIDTASNTTVKTILVGASPSGVAVTPDGKHVYVTNQGSNSVSVISTASNTVVATVPVGSCPVGVGIVPPPPGVPFLAFDAQLKIDLDRAPKEDRFELQSSFTLSSTARPRVEPVTLQAGTFTVTIPPGSFRKHEEGFFTFEGVIDGVSLVARIRPTGTLRYAFHANAKGANLTGTNNPVQVTLIMGNNSGTASVTAQISDQKRGFRE